MKSVVQRVLFVEYFRYVEYFLLSNYKLTGILQDNPTYEFDNCSGITLGMKEYIAESLHLNSSLTSLYIEVYTSSFHTLIPTPLLMLNIIDENMLSVY